MSRASAGLTPRSGMALPRSMDCGDSIQRIRLSGVLARWPAMMLRSAKLVSGGPTAPLAPGQPGLGGRPPHPDFWMGRLARLASPPGPEGTGVSAALLPRDRPVIVYCSDHQLGLSARAAARLETLGYGQVPR